MYFSLYQILDKLPYECQIKVCREKDAFSLRQAKIFFPGFHKKPESDALYLVRESDLSEQMPHLAHLLIWGNLGKEYSLPEALSVSAVSADGTDFFEIFDTLQDIFSQYQEQDSKINSSILSGASVQDVLDQCSLMLKHPIAIFDLQQNLLMKSGKMPEEMDPLWRYVLKYGRSPSEGDNAEEFNQTFSRIQKPFYYTSKDSFRNIYRLVAPLYCGKSLVGCIALHDPEHRPGEGEFADFWQIQNYISKAFEHSPSFRFGTKEIPWFIVQLLQGTRTDREVLDYNLQHYSHHSDEPFILWTFQKETGELNAEKIIPNLCYIWKTDLVFCYADSLLVLDYQPEQHQTDAFLESLNNVLSQNHLRCGKSMVFSDLAQLRIAWLQTQIALTAGTSAQAQLQRNPLASQPRNSQNTLQSPNRRNESQCQDTLPITSPCGKNISDYLDCYLEYILRAVQSQKESDGLIYPNLNRLIQTDPEYGTDLLLCLKQYIILGQNASKTAKALFIHRHTVLYRIQKIESILHLDLAQLNEKELVLLYFSCCILLRKQR